MHFSIKNAVAIAISMATLASAVPAEAWTGYRCCAFSDCTVCADMGSPLLSCVCDEEPFGYMYCCRIK